MKLWPGMYRLGIPIAEEVEEKEELKSLFVKVEQMVRLQNFHMSKILEIDNFNS